MDDLEKLKRDAIAAPWNAYTPDKHCQVFRYNDDAIRGTIDYLASRGLLQTGVPDGWQLVPPAYLDAVGRVWAHLTDPYTLNDRARIEGALAALQSAKLVMESAARLSASPVPPVADEGHARTTRKVEICPGVEVFMTQDQVIAWKAHVTPVAGRDE